MSMRRPEILAPAGTEEALSAALASGADAVYLGLSEGFNARARSTAFDLAGLPRLVRRAHAAGAKLYLTLNTLVFEGELEALAQLLATVIDSGVDALIVQDPATAFIARKLSPEVRLHASTQMTISSAEGARFAQTLGIERAVLPRELSTREIARFTRESPLEAEVFVHGALCMAWSGQCLTSEALSGRSANRGQCSQACRMPYDLIVDGKLRELGDVQYLLSPQDLAAHEALPELIEAGVHSLKIEGRYKGPAYVAAAVDSWRNYRDAIERGVTDEDRRRLQRDVDRAQLTFSRGASLGFLRGEDHQSLVVGTTPKHRGIALGEVVELRGRSVRVALAKGRTWRELLRPGLGVMFEVRDRRARGVGPESAPGGPIFDVRFTGDDTVELTFGQPGPELGRVRAGDAIRLTGDPELARQAEHRASQPLSGRIPLAFTVSGRAGEPLSVEARGVLAGRALRATARTDSALGPARSAGLDAALLEEKLGALGGTSFHLQQLDARALEPGLHAPVSELKRVRRALADALVAQLTPGPRCTRDSSGVVSELRRELARVEPTDGQAQLVPLCRTMEQLEAVIGCGFGPGDEVELDWMEMVGLSKAVERARAAGLKVTLATVRVQKPGEESYDRRIAALAPDAVLVRHWGALMSFAQASDPGSAKRPIAHGDFSLNVTNSLTALHLLGLGLATVTASHDLSREQLLALLAQVPRGRVALTLHHHIPTFHNSHCVYAHLLSSGKDYRSCGRPCEEHRVALRDFAGNDHPVVVDVSCRNTVFNAVAQSAAPLVPRLLELGVRRFRVELVWERADEVARTLLAYLRLLRGELTPDAALRAAAVHEQYGVTTLRR